MSGWLLRTRGWSCRGLRLEAPTVRLSMGRGGTARTISLVSLVWISPMIVAQGMKTPTLGEILERLESNLNSYDAGVPSLFCDEHVVSSRSEPKERELDTVTDSVFRLKRTPQPDRRTALVESRDIKSVNGRPSTSEVMDGPALLSGIFEEGLAVVSVGQAACMNYSLQRIDRKRPDEPYVVRFATVLTPQNRAGCLLQEESKGRVWIDPASMQVKRLEITTPHHVIADQESYREQEVGKRELSVDYAPVLLGGESFWMPSTITMRITTGPAFGMSVWSYLATYQKYHRLEVKSRILDNPE